MPYIALTLDSWMDADPAELLNALADLEAAPVHITDRHVIARTEYQADPLRLRTAGLEIATTADNRGAVERFLRLLTDEQDEDTDENQDDWPLETPPAAYLERYPDGPHAEHARELTEG